MCPQATTVASVLARIGSRTHGVVTREDLLAAGISPDQIRHRVRTGALVREYKGVYSVGHRAQTTEARYMAAVEACGERARLSGNAAAWLLSLIKGAPPPPEVTSPTKRRVPGVIAHRGRLHTGEVTTHRGIPITTVPRTLVDLAADLDLDDLARACHEAGVKYGTTPNLVKRVLARHPNAKGAPKLRRIFDGDIHVALSALERRFLELLRDAGLSLPVTNKPAGSRRVDCRWASPPLTVELDGYTYHVSRHAWERDRRREREAYARGDEFRRYTYGDVFEDTGPMLRELFLLLRYSAAVSSWSSRGLLPGN